MGLISFVKSAGAKIFGGGEKEDPSANAAEEARERLAAARAKRLAEEAGKFGLNTEGLDISVDGDTVKVSGQAADQATREKLILALGNTAGIANVDDQLSVAASEPEATYYTVVRGDTLSKIAKEQYGNASKYHAIFEANKPMLSDPDKIYPGQVLRIPPQG